MSSLRRYARLIEDSERRALQPGTHEGNVPAPPAQGSPKAREPA